MNNIILGAHNSCTSYKPKYWFMNLFQPFSKCQDLDIKSLFNKGVRFFDLRVKYDSKGEFVLGHGLVTYDVILKDIFEDFKLLILLYPKEKIFYRIMHENFFSLIPSENKANTVNFEDFSKDINNLIATTFTGKSTENIHCLDIRSKKEYNKLYSNGVYFFSYINSGWINPSVENYLQMGYIMDQADNKILAKDEILCDENYISKGAWWSLFLPLPRLTAKLINPIVEKRMASTKHKSGIHIYFIDFC